VRAGETDGGPRGRRDTECQQTTPRHSQATYLPTHPELYLRKLKKEQEALQEEILTEETANRAVQEEYTVKRRLVESGCERMGQIEAEIKRYRQMIERKFNPEKYR
jgi:hypothetical protein